MLYSACVRVCMRACGQSAVCDSCLYSLLKQRLTPRVHELQAEGHLAQKWKESKCSMFESIMQVLVYSCTYPACMPADELVALSCVCSASRCRLCIYITTLKMLEKTKNCT